MEKQLLEALKHILHTMDWDPNASDGEIMGAINWDYIRKTVEQAEKQLAEGSVTDE
jgi:hypothetical protein